MKTMKTMKSQRYLNKIVRVTSLAICALLINSAHGAISFHDFVSDTAANNNVNDHDGGRQCF